MENFTPVSALVGGAMIGLGSVVLMLFNGRVAGIAGIVGGLFGAQGPEIGWRLAFVAGLIVGSLLVPLAGGKIPDVAIDASLPMVVAAGGNSGGQAATMVIRAMALGEISAGNALRIAWKEARTGLFLGLSLGVAIAAFITLILPQLQSGTGGAFDFAHLAFAVAAAITVQVLSATVLGAMLPIGARAINLDPAVVSSPSLASTVDVSGMLIYFTTAGAILNLH